jgi:hypothetical protein
MCWPLCAIWRRGHTGGDTYRPEIDGLRALAIVPVVLFHAGFGAFSGGYVGVDVFFVISGYLITTIILTERIIGQRRMPICKTLPPPIMVHSRSTPASSPPFGNWMRPLSMPHQCPASR